MTVQKPMLFIIWIKVSKHRVLCEGANVFRRILLDKEEEKYHNKTEEVSVDT